jgi:hypothetical protein
MACRLLLKIVMAADDNFEIEHFHDRIDRLTGELTEIRARLRDTAVKLENDLFFVRLLARDKDRLAT